MKDEGRRKKNKGRRTEDMTAADTKKKLKED